MSLSQSPLHHRAQSDRIGKAAIRRLSWRWHRNIEGCSACAYGRVSRTSMPSCQNIVSSRKNRSPTLVTQANSPVLKILLPQTRPLSLRATHHAPRHPKAMERTHAFEHTHLPPAVASAGNCAITANPLAPSDDNFGARLKCSGGSWIRPAPLWSKNSPF